MHQKPACAAKVVTVSACRALGNMPLFDLEALPAATSNQSVYACTSDCNLLTYLTMVEGIPASLCNTSCTANEQAWAAATLSQTANKSSSCNAICQALHDSCIASIQALLAATAASTQRHLLQGTTTCVPVSPCLACDTPCLDPACSCSQSLYISAQLVPFPAACGAHAAGTVFGPYDSGCPPEPPTPYVPHPFLANARTPQPSSAATVSMAMT